MEDLHADHLTTGIDFKVQARIDLHHVLFLAFPSQIKNIHFRIIMNFQGNMPPIYFSGLCVLSLLHPKDVW